MLKYLSIAVTIAVLTSCGMYQVDNGVQKYVDSFEFEAARKGKKIKVDNIVIRIADKLTYFKEPWVVGECISGTPMRINIRKSAWIRYSDTMREEILFHELGHCVLFKLHSSEPGIMHKSIMPEEDYTLNREQYLKELFE